VSGALAGRLRRVFEPIEIRGVEIPNRVVRTAHLTKLGLGRVSDDLIEYHAARARGGVGLSILEATAVHPSSVLGLAGYDDSIIPTYQKLMDTVRPLGMRVFQQLWHGGHVYPAPGGLPMRGASARPGPVAGLPAVPIGTDEIGDFVAAYAAAARRSAEGGIDGLEVAASHGYLMHQFLSPLTNDREDRYGGSLDNRTRRLAALRLIDFLNASMGDYHAMHHMMGGMDRPAGYMLPSSGKITAAVTGIPRIVTGRFRTLEEAEQALRTGECDLVSMVRAHIADPDIVRKTRDGRAAEVRPCIGCNQGCIARTSGVDLRLGCTVNPAVGREKQYGDEAIGTTARPRRVVVIGGGPAGLEAARVARLRGHDVALVFDDVGQYEAVSVAEYLLQRGVHVTVATRLPAFGPLVDAAMRMVPALERLNSAPAEFTALARVTLASVGPGKATLRSLAGAARTTVAADLVVLVTHKASRGQLASDLAGRVPDIRVVGDALAARDLQVAIREGNDAARTIA
jgi:2,4-dienoyl-CoA reductase-like NADH-dependent reductase (Old Yellow Enzyme family)